MPLPAPAAPLQPPPPRAVPPRTDAWLGLVQHQVEGRLAQLLELPDEAGLDARWSRTLGAVRAYALRPAKRLRPALLLAGWALERGSLAAPEGLWRFAAGLELLHTFLLVHDDVADQAALRRGGPSLHRLLAPGRAGEDLAVVVGDHLYTRALEAFLGCGLPHAARATRHFLAVCRHTAVGQYLDLDLAHAPLGEVTLARALRVAHLKTARYGFCGPLVAGALLAGAAAPLIDALERVGRHLGRAYQLRDDLLGLFGDERLSGKPADGDFAQGKRTFPLLAAWARAGSAERRELETLWALPAGAKDAHALARARALVERLGGRAACERVVARSSRAALRALSVLPGPHASPARELLGSLIGRLAHRVA